MRKPKTAKQKYKHAYNVGYRAGKKYTNGNGLLRDIPLEVPADHVTNISKPIDKWIKLLSLLKEVA